MAWLKIDDVAKECGLTKRTIRYYEEIGLLPPPERSEGGIRLYTQQHIEYLKKIVNAKEVLGFSLQELQRFISISDTLQSHRQDYKNIADQSERKRKLLEIDQILGEQLELIEAKLQKILHLQNELTALRDRVRKAVAKIDEDQLKQM